MIIIETSIFTRRVVGLLPDDEYRKPQVLLANRPTAGDLIRGSGGLRKIRWSRPGQGKRGGVRVLYYWAVSHERLLMLYLYPKTGRADLPPAQIRLLRQIIETESP